MAYVEYDGLYFCEDGNYGGGPVIITDHDTFTDEQIELISVMSDNERYDYAKAVLNGEDLSKWEEDYA